MKLTELVQSRPDPLWTLMKQCGVDDAVALLDGAEQETRWLRAAGAPPPTFTDERPWGEPAIRTLQERLADHGLRMAAIEDTPPLDAVRLGLPGRDEQISHVIEQVRAMGRLGVPVLCYNWMAVTSWARTDVAVRIRGGALSTAYSHEGDEALPPLVEPGSITEEQLWDGLAYFLDAVVPEAEQAGVRLALHPDDPPRTSSRGVPRIIRSVDAFRRVLDLHPSPANAITLCQGNVALMTDACRPSSASSVAATRSPSCTSGTCEGRSTTSSRRSTTTARPTSTRASRPTPRSASTGRCAPTTSPRWPARSTTDPGTRPWADSSRSATSRRCGRSTTAAERPRRTCPHPSGRRSVSPARA